MEVIPDPSLFATSMTVKTVLDSSEFHLTIFLITAFAGFGDI